MQIEIILYSILLIFFNYGIPYLILRNSAYKYAILIIGGLLWFLESLLFINILNIGIINSGLLATFYLYTVFPIPYILLLLGAIIFFITLKKRLQIKT